VLNVLPKSVCSKWNRIRHSRGDPVDKFDALIGARSGFKGQELVDFNKGASKAAAKGALSGLETASYLMPLPLNAAHKATVLTFEAAKAWKVAQKIKVVSNALTVAKYRVPVAGPLAHKVVSVVGKSLGKFGQLQDDMLKAGRSVIRGPSNPYGPPKDLRRRVTQVVSETANKLVNTPSPSWMGPGAKNLIGRNISNRVVKPTRKVLREFAEFHSTAMGQGSQNQLFANILGAPIDTGRWKRTRAGLGKLDDVYHAASGPGSLNIGTSAPVLFGRYQLMREHVSNDTAIGKMNRKRKEKNAPK